jgi:transcriptional regulator with PAS, ATPase and Fis domain
MRVIPLTIPPLRERAGDIPALVDHFVEKISRREGIPGKRIEPVVVAHLAEQPWPGNVRELEHSIERAIALSGERRTLDVRDFPPFCDVTPLRTEPEGSASSEEEVIDLEQTVARLERALIEQALLKSHGNKARAAQMLGLKRSTLVSKVRVHQTCA